MNYTLKHSLILFLIIILFACSKNVKPDILITLHNVEYDSLILFGKDINGEKIKIYGEKNGVSWHFYLPDSAKEKIPYLALAPRSFDNTNYVSSDIRLGYISGKDTVFTFYLNNENENSVKINATYSNQRVYPNQYFSIIKNKENIDVVGSKVVDNFILNDPVPSDLVIRLQYPFFGDFFEKGTYDEIINLYATVAAKHPSSRYLISGIATNLEHYKQKKDVERIYNNFSTQNKQSFFGSEIQKYLSAINFENTILPDAVSGKPEYIIQHPGNYNLIIFSASWCAPCHELIPALKKIHTDLNKKMDITYITIDTENEIKNWNNLMDKERIPWRSLSAADNLTQIQNKYYVKSIPHVLFIHPDGVTETLNLSEAEDIHRLYNIVDL